MKKTFRQLLAAVTKNGELSVEEAASKLCKKPTSHVKLYPLAMLIEEGYLGITINYTPAPGSENMREFSLARSLHMLRLPRNKNGEVEYNGVTSSGSMNAQDERVFIKAKGQLYLEEIARKWEERAVYVLLGILVTVFTQWLLGGLNLS